ncbi:hypothetical protein LDENG_00256620 [Lucifuga dentata]|nr:hypothetical protein LDENG_00256620 [Lucifuga dentata]
MTLVFEHYGIFTGGMAAENGAVCSFMRLHNHQCVCFTVCLQDIWKKTSLSINPQNILLF